MKKEEKYFWTADLESVDQVHEVVQEFAEYVDGWNAVAKTVTFRAEQSMLDEIDAWIDDAYFS